MVAKIISGKSLIGALNYNENKVAQGKAELIYQNGYAKDINRLSFYDKLFRLKDYAGRNERVKTNTVHISLNFAAGEDLDKHKLNEIASAYMQGIGFSDQPYLVYQHKDAGHPHLHIVTTNVQKTGGRISLHNIGKLKSEPVRKQLEKDYGLIQADQRVRQLERPILVKVEYGKAETKRAVSNAVNAVVSSYKFTSLPEFNAVLNQFNVLADRGSKNSRMFAGNGLLYWALDKNGKKTGVPIKASSIYGKPILKNLEIKFQKNEVLRKPFKDKVRNTLNRVLKTKASEAGFQQALRSKGIEVIFRKNEQGRLYGVTYVDNHLKVVFNGSDLGKAYSAASLNEWFAQPRNTQNLTSKALLKNPANFTIKEPSLSKDETITSSGNLVYNLLKSDYSDSNNIPSDFLQKKRRKKRRHQTI